MAAGVCEGRRLTINLVLLKGLTSCRNFFSAALRTRCYPLLSPNFSKSVGVRSFSASSVSRSSFLRVSTLVSVSFVVVHHVSTLKLAIVYKVNSYNRVKRASWLESHNDLHSYSLHIYMGFALNVRHKHLILINRFYPSRYYHRFH